MRLLTVFLISVITVVYAGSKDAAAGPVPSWQQSESLNIQLGVRDKNGAMGSYEAVFTVSDPENKNIYEAKVTVDSDEWAFVYFPADFSVSALDGTYNWSCSVSGSTVSSGSFSLSDFQTDLKIPKK